jgi:hypothetical protein
MPSTRQPGSEPCGPDDNQHRLMSDPTVRILVRVPSEGPELGQIALQCSGHRLYLRARSGCLSRVSAVPAFLPHPCRGLAFSPPPAEPAPRLLGLYLSLLSISYIGNEACHTGGFPALSSLCMTPQSSVGDPPNTLRDYWMKQDLNPARPPQASKEQDRPGAGLKLDPSQAHQRNSVAHRHRRHSHQGSAVRPTSAGQSWALDGMVERWRWPCRSFARPHPAHRARSRIGWYCPTRQENLYDRPSRTLAVQISINDPMNPR